MEILNRHRRRLETFSYNYRAFLSGSSSEIPAAYFLTKPTDFDTMLYRADVCAVPKNAQPPRNFRGEVLTIDSEGLSAGFVRLKPLKLRNSSSYGCDQDYQRHLQASKNDEVNGPAVTADVGWSAFTFDKVYSVRCPYWPPEEQEWRTRYRRHGWPSKDLIDEIVSDGCFLVGKSHPNCPDGDATQWRYSFSKAEMKLISSWTDSQMYVYHVLRMIKSEFVKYSDDKKKTGICTYHLKTQMFWAGEESPAEFWEDRNLLPCICELLKQVQHRFTSRDFPNYFLPDCNIVDGIFIEDYFKDAIKMLDTDFGRSILKSRLPPKVCQECSISVSLPIEMALHAHFSAERCGVPFLIRGPKLETVQQLIHEELDDLMNGIYNMQLAKTLGFSYYAIAEQHFWDSISCADTVSNNFEVRRVTLTHRISLNTAKALAESLRNLELWTVVEARNKWDLYALISCTKSQCPYAGKSWNFPWDEGQGVYWKKWVKPSHLLAAAYLSNFYLTTGNYDTCNEVAQVEHRFARNASNSELFPMIFCPELASLFDENIQEVLGLLWLCNHLLNGGDTIFEFCTCPLLFLNYTRIRALFRVGDMELVKDAISEFKLHRGMCSFGLYLYSYHYLLPEMACCILIRSKRDETMFV